MAKRLTKNMLVQDNEDIILDQEIIDIPSFQGSRPEVVAWLENIFNQLNTQQRLEVSFWVSSLGTVSKYTHLGGGRYHATLYKGGAGYGLIDFFVYGDYPRFYKVCNNGVWTDTQLC